MSTTKLNLCLHTGGAEVPWGSVLTAPTPTATKSWHPIPHAALVRTVGDAIEADGMEIVQQVHALARDGARYFGMMQIAKRTTSQVGLGEIERDLIIGIRNSHDMAFRAGLVVGDGVFVCDNLCFSGEIQIGRKHTRFISRDLPRLVADAVGRLGNARMRQAQRFDHYRVTQLDDTKVNDLLVRSMDAKVISSSKIAKVLEEWRNPSHPEFAEAKNYHRLHAAYTEVLKGSNPFTLPATTQRLHGLLDTASGLPVIDTTAVERAVA